MKWLIRENNVTDLLKNFKLSKGKLRGDDSGYFPENFSEMKDLK